MPEPVNKVQSSTIISPEAEPKLRHNGKLMYKKALFFSRSEIIFDNKPISLHYYHKNNIHI